jgi:tryptophan halogenase
MLFDSGQCPTDTMRDFFNKLICGTFDYTRDFLSLHYKLNTRLDNEFWRHCRADTDLGALAPMLEFYTENGPTALNRLAVPMPERNTFGVDGHLAMLVGNRAPYKARYQPTDAERALFNKMRADLAAHAAQGVSVKEMLGVIRSPQWKWAS